MFIMPPPFIPPPFLFQGRHALPQSAAGMAFIITLYGMQLVTLIVVLAGMTSDAFAAQLDKLTDATLDRFDSAWWLFGCILVYALTIPVVVSFCVYIFKRKR